MFSLSSRALILSNSSLQLQLQTVDAGVSLIVEVGRGVGGREAMVIPGSLEVDGPANSTPKGS